jgi:hypothetical protein
MKLSQLTAKPQLIEISLDDEATIKEFGEPVTFSTWDRQNMDTFMKLASASEGKSNDVISIVKDLILDEHGDAILTGETMLPTGVLMKAIGKITEMLGK